MGTIKYALNVISYSRFRSAIILNLNRSVFSKNITISSLKFCLPQRSVRSSEQKTLSIDACLDSGDTSKSQQESVGNS